MVVNEKDNLVKTIVQVHIKSLNFLLTRSFLENITIQGLGNGVKRNNYYLINVGGMFRLPGNPPAGEYFKFIKFLEVCEMKGFTFLMLIL
jgi:hypothetical protein